MKLTKKMVDNAHDAHFRTETNASLDKAHALEYLYALQIGDKKMARYMERIPGVKRNAAKILAKKKVIRKKPINRKIGLFQQIKFSPTRF